MDALKAVPMLLLATKLARLKRGDPTRVDVAQPSLRMEEASVSLIFLVEEGTATVPLLRRALCSRRFSLGRRRLQQQRIR
jgi:hypothetical protein